MKGPAKAIVLAVAVLVLVGGAFWGGALYQGSKAPTGFAGTGEAMGMRGGPMADLTEDEQAELEGMTAEERQAWIQENMGEMGQGGPARGGNLEGEVIEVADDTITISVDSGSQTIYIDESTVVAYVEGAGELAAGATVMVQADPTTDGVTTATLVAVLR
jgi:preprotein translocase subunit YajC